MKKEELAKQLDGIEYPPCNTIPKSVINEAIENDLIIVYGLSDDLVEFAGAMHDEIGCYGGGTAFIDVECCLVESPDCDCEYAEKWYKQQCDTAKSIKAIWCENADVSWTYVTDIPHSTFKVMEDGEVYCVGFVFDKESLK